MTTIIVTGIIIASSSTKSTSFSIAIGAAGIAGRQQRLLATSN
jgi:hypothetical protein